MNIPALHYNVSHKITDCVVVYDRIKRKSIIGIRWVLEEKELGMHVVGVTLVKK